MSTATAPRHLRPVPADSPTAASHVADNCAAAPGWCPACWQHVYFLTGAKHRKSA